MLDVVLFRDELRAHKVDFISVLDCCWIRYDTHFVCGLLEYHFVSLALLSCEYSLASLLRVRT